MMQNVNIRLKISAKFFKTILTNTYNMVFFATNINTIHNDNIPTMDDSTGNSSGEDSTSEDEKVVTKNTKTGGSLKNRKPAGKDNTTQGSNAGDQNVIATDNPTEVVDNDQPKIQCKFCVRTYTRTAALTKHLKKCAGKKMLNNKKYQWMDRMENQAIVVEKYAVILKDYEKTIKMQSTTIDKFSERIGVLNGKIGSIDNKMKKMEHTDNKPEKQNDLANKILEQVEASSKQTEAALKQNEELSKQTDAVLKQNEEMSKRIDIILMQNEAMLKQNEEMSKRMDTTLMQNEAMLKQNEELTKRIAELQKHQKQMKITTDEQMKDILDRLEGPRRSEIYETLDGIAKNVTNLKIKNDYSHKKQSEITSKNTEQLENVLDKLKGPSNSEISEALNEVAKNVEHLKTKTNRVAASKNTSQSNSAMPHVEMSGNAKTKNLSVNNTANSTVSNTTNINIIKFGDENLDTLVPSCKQYFEQNTDLLIKLIEHVHCNPNFPEYRNCYVNNKSDANGMIHNGLDWKTHPLKEIIETLILNKSLFLKNKIDSFIEQQKDKQQYQSVIDFLKKVNDDDVKKDRYKTITDLLVKNNPELSQ